MNIGVIGGGVAGLHLVLFLQKHGIDTTLYAERTSDEIRASRLPNTAIHWHNVRRHDKELGVDHWGVGQECNHYWIGLSDPLDFRGYFKEKAQTVDSRLYCATLLDDYIERGGAVTYGHIHLDDLIALSEQHHLVVISSGRGSLTEVFQRVPDNSLTEPGRLLCTGIYRGIRSNPEELGVNFEIGCGELYEMPFMTFDGMNTALFFLIVPGGSWEMLMETRYEDDHRKFNDTVLHVVTEHFPHIRSRIDVGKFGLRSYLDYLQGAITPTVRRGYARLANGKYVVAIGDLQTVSDPIMGQGVGCATNGAFVVGQAILDEGLSLAFDERFCKLVYERIQSWSGDATSWTNHMLRVPPEPNTVDLMIAASKNQALADAFSDNFSAPTNNWNMLSTLERSRNLLHGLGMDSPTIDAALEKGG